MSNFKNPWVERKNKQEVLKEINQKLEKYKGRNLLPLDKLINQLRRTVIKYFRSRPDKVKLFTDDWMNYDFDFEIEEKNNIIIDVKVKL